MTTTPVAIIGMACLFAGAPDLRTYRDHVLGAVDAIGEAPPGWLPESDSARRNPSVYTTRGGWLGDLATFDPLSYGVMPSSIDGSEPEHFVALRLAAGALADAGYGDRPFPRRTTGVVLGRGTFVNRAYVSVVQHTIGIDQTLDVLASLHPDWPASALERIGAELREALPPFTAETAPGLAHSVMCGRIANRLDLMGPAYAVDAACASSLVALDLAMGDLESGRADLMLAGGVQVSTSFPIAALFCQLGALSHRGILSPFDPDADGTLLGEGAGVVVLKRLVDAERDGDHVYAVLRGVGLASDGQAMGILAPRVEGEELAVRRAYERAGVSPESIGLLEAHGTGTVVGDRTELDAIGHVWRTSAPGSVVIGSVKSMIGHTIPAAGIAGVIKTALALHSRVLPPSPHAEGARRRLEGTPFRLEASSAPWVHAGEEPRRAAVSSFGFGGIDAHAVLEEHRATPPPTRTRCGDPTELFVLSGPDRSAVVEQVHILASAAEDEPPDGLADLARRFPARAPTGPVRAAVVADAVPDLAGKLTRLAERLADPDCHRVSERRGIYYSGSGLLDQGSLALVLPGEGSQHPGMLRDVCCEMPAARRWFDLLDAALPGRVPAPSRIVFGPHDGSLVDDLGLAVLAVYAADRAALAVLDLLGVRPDMVAGHSSGEFAALAVSGATPDGSEEAVLTHMRRAAELSARAERDGIVPGAALLAVGAAPSGAVEQALAGEPAVRVALDNCPHQQVLCGPADAVDRVAGALAGTGALCRPLTLGRAYHTPAFAPMAERLAGLYADIPFESPRVPLFSCVTAAPVPEDPDAVRELALRQWVSPVRFRDTVEAMYAAGARVFVEAGPGDLLTGMVRDILGRRPHLVVGLESPGRSSIAQLHHLAAQLVVSGADLRLDVFEQPAAPDDGRRPIGLDLSLPVLRYAGPAPTPGPAAAARGHLAGLVDDARVLDDGPDRVELVLELDAGAADFLDDHRLGPRVSDDGRPGALAVLPLAVAVELLVQTVARRDDHRGTVRLDGLRADRWVTFPAGRAEVRLVAERCGTGWAAALWHGDASTPSVSAAVTLGGDPAPADAVGPPVSGDACRWAPTELYGEGVAHGMFHGPSLQGVASVDAVARQAVTARLRAPGASSLAVGTRAAPLLLDAAGQVLGYWAAQVLDEHAIVFPVAVDSLEITDPGRAGPADCRVDVVRVGADDIVADLDVAGPGVRLVARGWRVRRTAISPRLYSFRLDPRHARLCEPLPVPVVRPGLAAVRLRLDDGLLAADGGLWEEVLAHLALSGSERAAWAVTGRRRTPRLLGRVAAKDAVRELVTALTGEHVHPVDVGIGHDGRGRPVVCAPLAGVTGIQVSVSVAGEEAVAVATADPTVAGIGIDVERLDRVPDLAAALTVTERALLAAAPADRRAEHALSMWCAKEATVKALGTGFAPVGGPHRASTSPVPGRPGLLRVSVPPAGEVVAATWRDHGCVHALVLRESAAARGEAGENRVHHHDVVRQADEEGDQLAHPLR